MEVVSGAMKRFWVSLLLLAVAGCGDSNTTSLDRDIERLERKVALLENENAELRERTNSLGLDLEHQRFLNNQLQARLKEAGAASRPAAEAPPADQARGPVGAPAKAQPSSATAPAVPAADVQRPSSAAPPGLARTPSLPDIRPKTEAPKPVPEPAAAPPESRPAVAPEPPPPPVAPKAKPEAEPAQARPERSAPPVAEGVEADSAKPRPARPTAEFAEADSAKPRPARPESLPTPEDPFAFLKKPGYGKRPAPPVGKTAGPEASKKEDAENKTEPKPAAPPKAEPKPTVAEKAEPKPAPPTKVEPKPAIVEMAEAKPAPGPVRSPAPKPTPRLSSPAPDIQFVNVGEFREDGELRIAGHLINNTDRPIVRVRVKAVFLDLDGRVVETREGSVGGGARIGAGARGSFEVFAPRNPDIASYRLTATADQVIQD